MSRPRGLIPALALGGALALAGLPASANESQRYEVYLGGLKAGDMQLEAQESGSSYSVRGRMQPGGVLGYMVKFLFQGQAQGGLTGAGSVRPARYEGKSQTRGRNNNVLIEFGPNAPRNVVLNPKPKPRPYRLDPTAQRNVVDPLSTAYDALRARPRGQICNRSWTVFDGLKTSRVTLSRPRQESGAVLCDGSLSRVGGYSPKDMAEAKSFPFTIHYVDAGDGTMKVSKFVTRSIFGTIVAHRR
ncbi:DUF3108 domain-containing protein [Oceanomicrobium pacificus]|uniref:DUF3108 domain-containing protein n=1 Tax=Oceanomicrobium pacificus TaxID=2692916 RepID=A0A6B0TPP0_9RHOB|nr:DUF3108 domain-containing protein [Oceanomicrobium pacificus]MXU66577.1 DUF3108 domain-containing protein [Oceanomicrobium pacificus]